MSDVDAPAYTPDQSATGEKRTSQSGKSKSDLNRERKRAADRQAQRTFREKNKLYTAHLEQMVTILRERNDNELARKLITQVEHLTKENESLRKAMDKIQHIASNQEPKPKKGKRQVMQEQPESSESETAAIGPTDNTTSHPLAMTEYQSTDIPKVVEMKDSVPIHESPATVDHILQEEVMGTCQPQDWQLTDPGSRIVEISQGPEYMFNLFDPSISTSSCNSSFDRLHASARINRSIRRKKKMQPQSLCPMWLRSNRVFANVFRMKSYELTELIQVNANHLFKALIKGWHSLDQKELNNPLISIIHQVDQGLFAHLNRVSRFALMYKDLLLLKSYLTSGETKWQNIWPWQRPVYSQSAKQHAIAIDFFAWPGLRDHLVRYDFFYTRTSDFSIGYRRYFKFSWPFRFENTYVYCEKSDTYEISPLFESYLRDLQHWGLQKPFFHRFPELADIIPVTVYSGQEDDLPVSLSCLTEGGSPPSDVSGTVEEANGSSGLNLFDYFPNVT